MHTYTHNTTEEKPEVEKFTAIILLLLFYYYLMWSEFPHCRQNRNKQHKDMSKVINYINDAV